MNAGPLLERIRSEGASAAIADVLPAGGALPDLVAAIRRAVSAHDDAAASRAAWDEAGLVHTPETLDEALGLVAPRLGVPFLAGLRRRRLRVSARRALEATAAPGTVQLTAAVLGAVGGREDAAVLEEVAVHPLFTLHAATALANLAHWEGRASLLRLLSRTNGAERVVVIDRLLPSVREPAVRLALVRDAFTGLPEADAREVAPAVVEALDLRTWLDDARVSDDLRAAARRVLALARR